MENPHEDTYSRETVGSEVGLSSTTRWVKAKERQVQFQREREEAARERREGRMVGKLTPSLAEKLRSCNVAQLKRVKKRPLTPTLDTNRTSHTPVYLHLEHPSGVP
jgi:hypothetical protein